jgi:pimeloyl-ACP methyl ester carboxylesterase
MTAAWRECFVPATDGTRLYVRERDGAPGVAITAVLCDGIACDGFIWRWLVDDLAPIANILHWHYRGHGRSAAPVDPERIDAAALADDLASVLEARVREPAVLFGHSAGCQIALEAWRRVPERVRAMVLVCGAPGRLTHTFKGSDALARALPRLIEAVDRHPILARALWSNFPPSASARIALATAQVDASSIDPTDLVRYSEHVASLDLRLFLRMLHALGEQSAEDLLPTVAVPVLVIAGVLDSFTPLYLAERMAASIPKSELFAVPGATHVVPIERREAVRDRVLGFLRERALTTP